MTNKNIFQDFLNYYQSLSEKEKFVIGKEFNEKTGGKLSPFNSPEPVAVALIGVEDYKGNISLLALRRAIEPNKGKIALPGGYIDKGESLQEAVCREVMEETSISFNKKSFSQFSSPLPAGQNTLLIFMHSNVNISFDKFIESKEILRKKVLNFEDVEASELVLIDNPNELSFPLHQKMADSYLSSLNEININTSSFISKPKSKLF